MLTVGQRHRLHLGIVVVILGMPQFPRRSLCGARQLFWCRFFFRCGYKGVGLRDRSRSGDLYHRSAWCFVVPDHPERLFCVARVLEHDSHEKRPVGFQRKRNQSRRDLQDV